MALSFRVDTEKKIYLLLRQEMAVRKKKNDGNSLV